MPVSIRGHGQCFVVGIGIWRDDHDLTIWNDTFDVGVVFFIVDAGSNEEILLTQDMSRSTQMASNHTCLDIIVYSSKSKIAVRCLEGKIRGLR